MAEEAGDAKRRRIEEGAEGQAQEDVAMKEEPQAEAEPPKELEEDARPEKRPALAQEIRVELRDATLNCVPALGGRVLRPLVDGGLQFLLAGARANVGVRKGRYLFEVKIVETLNSSDQNSRSSRAPMPRQLVRVGFSTQDSTLFLGETEDSVCFDSEGFFTADKKRLGSSDRFSRDQTVAVLLNLDRKSRNADTVSLFRDGVRVSQPQPLPEHLVDKALFPHVNFKNVTLQVNFGPSTLTPLPFTCRTMQEAAKDDTVVLQARPADGKYEVLFPVGLPDEGTFDWLDGFLDKNPHYTELSDRQVLRWSERSGLWRPQPSSWKNSNDKPDMNFGIPLMEDSSIRRVLNSVVASQPRDYIIMEVKANLLSEARQELLQRFSAPCYKRVALVVMGEPPEDFKAKMRESMLREKQERMEQEWRQRRLEKERKRIIERQQKELAEAKKREELALLSAEAGHKDGAEPVPAEGQATKPEGSIGQKELKEEKKEEEQAVKEEEEKAKEDAGKPAELKEEKKEEKAEAGEGAPDAPTAAKREAEEEEGDRAQKSGQEEEEPPPVAELTEEERSTWFPKRKVPDLTSWVLGTTFLKFSLPKKDEGFDEIRYVWQPEAACQAYLQEFFLRTKVRCRVEDLQPSEAFRVKLAEWQKAFSEWNARQTEFKETTAFQAKKKDVVADEAAAAPAESAEVEDVFAVKDVGNAGPKGEPLFLHFVFEDWALLSLSFELHLLVHSFRKDVGDPERIGIHEEHLSFYYNKYYRKPLNAKYYGVDTNHALVALVKDVVGINAKNSVLEAKLPEEPESLDVFVQLAEQSRRERQRRLDAGDETVRLRFSKPETPPPPAARVPQPVPPRPHHGSATSPGASAAGGGPPWSGSRPYLPPPRPQAPERLWSDGGAKGGFKGKAIGSSAFSGSPSQPGGGKSYGGKSQGYGSGGYGYGDQRYGKGYGK